MRMAMSIEVVGKITATNATNKASKMGEGVTYVSGKKITAPDREGFTATYAFTDINKVKLTTNPPDLGGGGSLKINSKGDNEPVTFTFAKGKTAELTVTTPAMKPTAPKSADEAAQDATNEASGGGEVQFIVRSRGGSHSPAMNERIFFHRRRFPDHFTRMEIRSLLLALRLPAVLGNAAQRQAVKAAMTAPDPNSAPL